MNSHIYLEHDENVSRVLTAVYDRFMIFFNNMSPQFQLAQTKKKTNRFFQFLFLRAVFGFGVQTQKYYGKIDSYAVVLRQREKWLPWIQCAWRARSPIQRLHKPLLA